MNQQTFLSDDWQSNHKYRSWRETSNGRVVYNEAKKIALRLKNQGKRAGIRDMWSFIRVGIMTGDVYIGNDENNFKVNNDYSKLAAYELEDTEPELKDYFEHRS